MVSPVVSLWIIKQRRFKACKNDISRSCSGRKFSVITVKRQSWACLKRKSKKITWKSSRKFIFIASLCSLCYQQRCHFRISIKLCDLQIILAIKVTMIRVAKEKGSNFWSSFLLNRIRLFYVHVSIWCSNVYWFFFHSFICLDIEEIHLENESSSNFMIQFRSRQQRIKSLNGNKMSKNREKFIRTCFHIF